MSQREVKITQGTAEVSVLTTPMEAAVGGAATEVAVEMGLPVYLLNPQAMLRLKKFRKLLFRMEIMKRKRNLNPRIEQLMNPMPGIKAVSYTHLTLPTK